MLQVFHHKREQAMVADTHPVSAAIELKETGDPEVMSPRTPYTRVSTENGTSSKSQVFHPSHTNVSQGKREQLTS